MKIQKSFQHDAVQCFQFGSYPFGKPRMFSHIYFLDGLLIDTGHSNMRKEVLDTIRSLPVEQLFITHHHEDHSGNIAPLQAHFNCPAYASARCIEFMKKPPNISFAQWMTWGKSDAVFNLQVEETEIKTPNYHFQLIPIPGHAADMLALYEAQQGWLFSADLWVKEYIRYFMRPESMAQQIDSIKRVLTLDFDILFCSHNPQLAGGKEKLRQKLAFLEDFYGRAATFYHQGYSANAILKAMGLKENWNMRLLSTGELSTLNMVKAVIRDEEARTVYTESG